MKRLRWLGRWRVDGPVRVACGKGHTFVSFWRSRGRPQPCPECGYPPPAPEVS